MIFCNIIIPSKAIKTWIFHIILSTWQTGLEIGHRADETLNNFCEWQAALKNEIHHDHAILMTGIDICVDKNGPCDTIGKWTGQNNVIQVM